MDPITGKRVPVPKQGVDLINPKKLPHKVTVSETAKATHAMAELRQQWAQLDAPDRNGAKGRAITQQYRHHSAKFKALTGQEPVPVYADQ